PGRVVRDGGRHGARYGAVRDGGGQELLSVRVLRHPLPVPRTAAWDTGVRPGAREVSAACGGVQRMTRRGIARVPGFDALQQDRRVGELIQPMGLPTNASTPR